MKRAGKWFGDVLESAPPYREWGPYWVTAFAAGVAVASPGWQVPGFAAVAFGPLVAHAVRHVWTRGFRYRYGFACPCGALTVSANDQAVLKTLRDAHKARCRLTRPEEVS